MQYDIIDFPLDNVRWYAENIPDEPQEPGEPGKPCNGATADAWRAYADALDRYADHKAIYEQQLIAYNLYCDAFLEAYRKTVRILYGSRLTLWSIDFESMWDETHEKFDDLNHNETYAQYIYRVYFRDNSYINWLQGVCDSTSVSGMIALKDRVNAITGIITDNRETTVAEYIIDFLHCDCYDGRILSYAYAAYDYKERNVMLNTCITAAVIIREMLWDTDRGDHVRAHAEALTNQLSMRGYAVDCDAVCSSIVYNVMDVIDNDDYSFMLTDTKFAQVMFCLVYGLMTSERFASSGLGNLSVKSLKFILSDRTEALKDKMPYNYFNNLERLIKKQIKIAEKKD